MLKIKLTAGSRYISEVEEQAVQLLQQHLSTEDGYIIPVMFVGKRVTNREIDVILLLPDYIFLLDFKNWVGERIEVEGINGQVRHLIHNAWQTEHNSLSNYEYAARELASRLRRERWLPFCPHIHSMMVFTNIGFSHFPDVSFTGGDPHRPAVKEGVGVCRLEQLAQLIAAFRATSSVSKQLDASSRSKLANILIGNVKTPAVPTRRRIEGYSFIAEHHTDTFLGCKIYLGEGEPIKEQVWIKEYEQVLASPERRSEREQLVLRHADILHRFPQHTNIVHYRIGKSSASHLYVILSRTPGAFLSELLSGKPLGSTTQADLERIPFDLNARLHILGDLLRALDYITRQRGFEKSAYRDMRPGSIFVQDTGSTPTAQLFNFDCTKLPGMVTRHDYLKEGRERFPAWETYASPELLAYIESGSTTSEGPAGFTGDVKSDIFSWAVIAWQMLTGSLPFPDAQAKLTGRRSAWSDHPTLSMLETSRFLPSEHVYMIKASLELHPANRPGLQTLMTYFP